MDGNKDEAEKCIRKAEKYIVSGEKDKAVKFLLKALRLYPTKEAQDWLNALNKTNGYHTKFNEKKHQKNNEKSFSDHELEYTAEQLAEVNRIKLCKDYYEILGVPKDADKTEIQKRYKKLSLQFHPDKNKAPGATEAFVAIGKAFTILSDPDRRRQYDIYGSDIPSVKNEEEVYEYHEGEFTIDELLNFMVSGNFSNRHRQFFRRSYTQPRFRNAESNSSRCYDTSLLLQLLPILMVVMLSIIGNLLTPEVPYSLQLTSKFTDERFTSRLHVPYFVQPEFEKHYQSSHIRKIEDTVETEYIDILRQKCMREQHKQMYNAFHATRTYPTPSCDKLKKIYPLKI